MSVGRLYIEGHASYDIADETHPARTFWDD
jgi:hypothetical protein